MGLGTVISGIFSKGAADLAGAAFNGLDELITSKEELGEQTIKMSEIRALNVKNRQDFQLKQQEIKFNITDRVYKDRQSAREMGKTDPWTPRILTIIFTLAYFAITGFMFSIVTKMFNQDINDFVVAFISTIFGAFNAIMVQIISYFFGGSKGGDDTGAAIASSFSQAAKKTEQ